jgi:acyl-CoA thioester hydrolase
MKEGGTMEDVLSACTVTMNIPVAWGEMDAMGHINNIIYFRYFETVRIEYFNRLDMMGYARESGIGPILASTECHYKLPLQYPDMVIAGTKILSMEEDRFVMGYEVFSIKHKRIAADGNGVIVTYDYHNNKKVPIPDVLKAKIMELEKMGNCKRSGFSVPGGTSAGSVIMKNHNHISACCFLEEKTIIFVENARFQVILINFVHFR